MSNDFNPSSPASSARYVSSASYDMVPRRTSGARRSDMSSQKSKKVFMEIYNAVKNSKDSKGRDLSIPFLQLPSRQVISFLR